MLHTCSAYRVLHSPFENCCPSWKHSKSQYSLVVSFIVYYTIIYCSAVLFFYPQIEGFMDSVSPPGPSLSVVSLFSLLACGVQGVVAFLLATWFGGQSSVTDRWMLVWLFYNVIVHITLVRDTGSGVWIRAHRQAQRHGVAIQQSNEPCSDPDSDEKCPRFLVCLVFLTGRSICLHVPLWDSGHVARFSG